MLCITDKVGMIVTALNENCHNSPTKLVVWSFWAQSLRSSLVQELQRVCESGSACEKNPRRQSAFLQSLLLVLFARLIPKITVHCLLLGPK